MANQPISSLTALTSAAAGDLLPIVDISDTTQASTGTTKKIAYSDLGFVTLTGVETLSNKTLTAPKFVDGGFLADANGNEIIILDTVASAVNEITIANAATGGIPTITASGDDTNINLILSPKGTGVIGVINNATTTYVAATMTVGAIPFKVGNTGQGGYSSILLTSQSLTSNQQGQAVIAAFNEGASDVYTTLAFGTRDIAGLGEVIEGMRLTSRGNFKVGGSASRGTTEGAKHISIFDGTAPVGTLANGVSLYSVAGKLWAMDAAGNATQLTP